MGTSITTCVEIAVSPGEWRYLYAVHPFQDVHYGVFGWLAGVRNYSDVPPIAAGRGVPARISDDAYSDLHDGDFYSHTYVTLAELLDFFYDAPVEDRRITVDGDGGCTAAPGCGRLTTYREFLGQQFFTDLFGLTVDPVVQSVPPDQVRILMAFSC
jgi:hypothetical protein